MPKSKLVPLTAKPRRVSGKGGGSRTIAIPKMFFRLTGIEHDADLLANIYLEGKKLVIVLSVQNESGVV